MRKLIYFLAWRILDPLEYAWPRVIRPLLAVFAVCSVPILLFLLAVALAG